MKRLFLFAGYDKDAIIDDTLVHYLNELSRLGDIVLVMDCEVKDTSKLKGIKNILRIEAARHNEYDFGSYKRGYMWAYGNKILEKYDWVYLVNDSVYGPLFDLSSALKDLESRGVDMTGMCSSEINRFPVHIQSWFVGLSKRIITAPFFKEFISNVNHQEDKALIVLKYEVRMTRIILEHGYKMATIFNDKDAVIYKTPNTVLNAGVPFVKKATMTQIREIEFLTPYTTETFVNQMISYAKRHERPYIYKHLPYEKLYRFSLIGLPLFSIFIQRAHWGTSYKIHMFDKIPIIKIVKNKTTQEG